MADRSTALSNAVVCATGLSSGARAALQRQVQSMGGEWGAGMSNSTTHLVALTVGSEKYVYATRADKGIPVVRPSWVEASHAQGAAAVAEHGVPPFAGLHVTVTGMDANARKRVCEAVTRGGGSYAPGLMQGTTTHLVAACPEGAKFDVATSGGIHVVADTWVWQSVQARVCLPEQNHRLVGQRRTRERGQGQGSGAAGERGGRSRRRSSHRPEQDEGAASQRGDGALSPGALADASVDEQQLSCQGAEVQVGNYLDDCVVFEHGFGSSGASRVARLLRAGGATRVAQFDASVTHVLLSNGAAPFDCHGVAPAVVRSLWLAESCTRGEQQEPAQYRWSLAQPVAQPTPRRLVRTGSAEPAQGGSQSAKRAKHSAQLFDGMQFTLAEGLAASARVAAQVEQHGGKLIGADCEAHTCHLIAPHGAEASNGAGKVVTADWIRACVESKALLGVMERLEFTPVATSPIAGYQDCRFCQSGFVGADRQSVASLLELSGAKVDSRLSKSCTTHLVCAAASGAKFESAVKWGVSVVTAVWLGKCVAAGKFETLPRRCNMLAAAERHADSEAAEAAQSSGMDLSLAVETFKSSFRSRAEAADEAESPGTAGTAGSAGRGQGQQGFFGGEAEASESQRTDSQPDSQPSSEPYDEGPSQVVCWDASLALDGPSPGPDRRRAPASAVPPLFELSGFTSAIKNRTLESLGSLGGVSRSSSDERQATHLISGKALGGSAKVLAALARGAWILSTEYVDACTSAGAFLPEAAFEYSGEGSKDDAPRRCRDAVARRGRALFSGKIFAVCAMENEKKMLQIVLTAGGGVVRQVERVDQLDAPLLQGVEVAIVSEAFTVPPQLREQVTVRDAGQVSATIFRCGITAAGELDWRQ